MIIYHRVSVLKRSATKITQAKKDESACENTGESTDENADKHASVNTGESTDENADKSISKNTTEKK